MDLLSHIEGRLGDKAARDGVLVAWSGGLDSTVLLDLVERWARRTGAEVAAVHIDHGLRPSSKLDAAFCQRIAHQRGLPLVVERLDIRRTGSMQESARLQRYAAIGQIARALDLGVVVTAHHADDAIETALLNLRRGSSAGGLSTLLSQTDAPTPAWPALELIRPLIACTKAELREYASARELSWQLDPTNQKTSYQRNLLREEVLPALSDHGALTGPIYDTLANLSVEHEALHTIASDHLECLWLDAPDADSVALRASGLAPLPEAIITRVLQLAAGRLSNPVGFGREHLTEAVAAIKSSVTTRLSARGASISVERGVVLIETARGRGGRHLGERAAEPVVLDMEREAGQVPWFGSRLEWRRTASQPPDSDTSVLVARLALRRADEALVLRGPRDGDRLDAAAMDGRKSAGDVFAEAGVPRALRWRWPCLARAGSGELVWICGLRQAASGEAPDDGAAFLAFEWQVEANSIFAQLTGTSGESSNLQYR